MLCAYIGRRRSRFFICKMRKKLAGASNGTNYIETVWGQGYVLRESSEDEAKMSA